MNITIQLPDEIAGVLRRSRPDLSRLVLESMAAAAYSQGLISRAQVGKVLGLASRFDVEEFLHQAGANMPYDEKDFDQDLATLARVGDR